MTLFTYGRWPRRATMTAVLAGAVLIALVSLPAAGTAKPKAPRMVAAVMQDRDGDGRADRLRVSVPKRVRPTADRDERIRSGCAGYRVRSVAKAAGPPARPASRREGRQPTPTRTLASATGGPARAASSTGHAGRRCVRRSGALRAHGRPTGTGPGSRPTHPNRSRR